MISSTVLNPVGLTGVLETALDAPCEEQTRTMLSLWESKLGNGKLPYRSDFTMAEMKDCLGHIYIIEAIDDGADFLVRLAGTALAEMFGEDFTGAKFSDDRLAAASWRLPIFRKALETSEPVMCRFLLGPDSASRVITENLMLPVYDKSEEKTILMCVSLPVGALSKSGQRLD